jgi:hypothetical protein
MEGHPTTSRARREVARRAAAAGLVGALVLAGGCTAGVHHGGLSSAPDGGGDGQQSNNPFAPAPGAAGASGADPFAGGVSGGGAGGSAPACMEAKYSFVPKTPTVFLLVDQSGSMFACRSSGGAGGACANHADTSWYPLRDGVLEVVGQLGKQVRFGFAAFTGEMGDAQCPKLSPVPPALDNAAAISTQYQALTAPRKGETPTKNALASVGALLAQDQAPGEKFILFVTDGQPDYCDDGNPLCPPDSVVGELQTLSKAGIKTLVFGISSPLTTISDAALGAFANAGAGEPVAPLVPNLGTVFDNCSHVAPWAADLAAAGKMAVAGQTVGDYTAAGGGQAQVFKPDVTNQQALVDAISAALSGVKSCVFDLGKLDGKPIKVDLAQLDKAHVLVMGTEIPRDDTNGWRMTSGTQLELTGSACATWRKPENATIDFQFPCQILIIP